MVDSCENGDFRNIATINFFINANSFFSTYIKFTVLLILWIQGTMALEFLEQVPDLDAILVPVSAGGMLAGICVAAKSNIKSE